MAPVRRFFVNSAYDSDMPARGCLVWRIGEEESDREPHYRLINRYVLSFYVLVGRCWGLIAFVFAGILVSFAF